MMVLHVSSAQGFRGGEQQALYLMQALQARGIKQVLASPKGSVLLQHVNNLGIPCIAFSNRAEAIIRIRKWAAEPKSAKGIIGHAHDSHAHTILWLTNLVASFLPFTVKDLLPFVVSRRVYRAPSPPSWTRGKYVHPALKGILCVSEAVAQLHFSTKGIVAPIHVVYSAVELVGRPSEKHSRGNRLTTLLKLPPQTVLVGTVAALAPEKDTSTFVKTCAGIHAANPSVHFIHIGTGNEAQVRKLQNMVSELGLTDNFHALGFQENAVELIGDFTVFLFTTKWEGLGSSILQAQTRGVPVVTTAVGGTTELVEHGLSGFTAPVGEWRVLAKAVLDLLGRELVYQQISEAGIVNSEKFSVDVMAEKTLAIYQEALKVNT